MRRQGVVGMGGSRRFGIALVTLGVVALVSGLAPAAAEEEPPVSPAVVEEAPATTAEEVPPTTAGEPGPTTDTTAFEESAETTDTTVAAETTDTATADTAEATDPTDTTAAPDTTDTTVTTDATVAPPEEDLPPARKGDPVVAAAALAEAEGDLDHDDIPDITDNCDVTFNFLQGDVDLDGLGNACDPDFGEQDQVGGTIYENRLCQAITLVPNDDSSSPDSQKIFFPQALNFFGAEQRFAFVNNNGNITFVNALGTFTPFEITSTTPPIIAPFFADVDTRPVGGGKVSYGVALNAQAFGGRNVTCVTWEHVGYFSNNVDKRNTFQLLIVDRSDVSPGDFDIYFNYAELNWETGDASGGENGLGGTSAGAGFSSGTGVENAFFSMPCSLVNGACLDSNQATGLRRTSTNSTIRGRHIFRVRGGAELFPGSIEGTIELNDPPLVTQPLVNALVEICESLEDGFGNCRSTFTVVDGSFDVTNLGPGDYRVRVFPQRIGGRNAEFPRRGPGSDFQPSGVGVDPLPIEVLVEDLGDGEHRVLDLSTRSGTPPPAGVTLGTLRNGGFFPHIVAGRATTFTVNAPCPTDGTFEIRQEGRVIASGTLRNQGQGRFTATVVANDPGPMEVVVDFPGCNHFSFDGYIDPSGLVVDQDGTPIPGATVTLFRSDFPEGPFEQVPQGSEIMSPANRFNPDTTDETGFFGWDTLSGFYRVDAHAEGCTDGSTAVLPVPPEQVDLRITLTCAKKQATTTTTASTTTSGATQAAGTALPRTGSDVGGLLAGGLVLVVGGAVLVVAGGSRRRSTCAGG